MNKTFSDLVVLELASVLAGPSVGMFFAEMGAKVIKIENKKTGGDITRTWITKKEQSNNQTSSYYASINWGKEIHFLDFTDNFDYNLLQDLIRNAHIIITNFKKNDDIKFKLNDATIVKINPSVIIGKINGFGANSNKVAYDLILQAESGFMSMNGTKKSGPLKMPVAFIDILAAHQLKEGILIAILNKYKTGKGSVVEVSLFDAAIASLVNRASAYINTNNVPTLIGSLHPNIAPYGEIFTTLNNKKIVLAIGSDSQFNKLCKILNLINLPANVKYKTNIMRVKNRNSLSKLLNQAINRINYDDLEKNFKKMNIPFGLIKNLKEVIDNLDNNKFLEYKNSQYKVIKSVVFKLKQL